MTCESPAETLPSSAGELLEVPGDGDGPLGPVGENENDKDEGEEGAI